MRRALNG
jgi:ABC-type uncharacterized transport system permease subunit